MVGRLLPFARRHATEPELQRSIRELVDVVQVLVLLRPQAIAFLVRVAKLLTVRPLKALHPAPGADARLPDRRVVAFHARVPPPTPTPGWKGRGDG